MKRNTWMFEVFDLETGQKLDRICFYGADSEEAFVNCTEWSTHHYGKDCHAEIVDAELFVDEKRREDNKKERMIERKENERSGNHFYRIKKVMKEKNG